MTLLISVFAAIICSILWYRTAPKSEMRLGTLSLMYWGASLMWFVDAIFEYVELGAAYYTPAAEDMLGDAFLGLSVVALGMIIWLVYVLIKDPNGVVKSVLFQKKRSS